MKKLILPFLFLMLCVVYSCKKNTTINDPEKETASKITDPVLLKIQSLGYSPYNVKKVDGGYIVEGDIFLSMELKKSGEVTTKHYSMDSLVRNLPRIITISTSGLGTIDGQAVDVAITRYNNLQLDLTFSRVSSGGDIVISGYYDSSSGVQAAATPPANGNPGPTIAVNTAWTTYVNDVNWSASLIQHELGHCIGLRHTDLFDRSYSGCPPFSGGDGYNEQTLPNPGANHIPGTPTGPEPNSLMLSCRGYEIGSFTANDVKALRGLYDSTPAAIPYSSSAAAIHRYWNDMITDHYYSQEYSTGGLNDGEWAYEGLVFYAYLNEPSGTIPVYRYWNSTDGNHFYEAASPHSISGYVYEGRAFNAFSYQAAGTVPLYRYYDPTGVDHYYTTDYYPYGFGSYQWNGLVFYVYPAH